MAIVCILTKVEKFLLYCGYSEEKKDFEIFSGGLSLETQNEISYWTLSIFDYGSFERT